MADGVGDYVTQSPAPTLEILDVNHGSSRGVAEGPLASDASYQWGQTILLSTPQPTEESQRYWVSFPRRMTVIHFPMERFQVRVVNNTSLRIHLFHRHVQYIMIIF